MGHIECATGDWGDTVSWSQSGLLLTALRKGESPVRELYVIDVSNETILEHRVASLPIQWDGDSSRIVYPKEESDGAYLVTWDVHNREEKKVFPLSNRLYSPSMDHYLVKEENGKDWLVKSSKDDSLKSKISYFPEKANPRFLSWSPSGEYIAWHNDRNLQVVNANTGEMLRQVNIGVFAPTISWVPKSDQLAFWDRFIYAGAHPFTGPHFGGHPNLRIVDLNTGKLRQGRITLAGIKSDPNGGLRRFDGPYMQRRCVWSPDNNEIVTEHGIGRWDIKKGHYLEKLQDYDPNILLEGWPETETVVGIVLDRQNSAWNQKVRTKILRKTEPLGWSAGMAMESGNILFIDSADKETIRIVDSKDLNKVVQELKLKNPIADLGTQSCFQWKTLFTREKGAKLNVWNLEDGSLRAIIDAEELFGASIVFEAWADCHISPDNKRAILRLRVNGYNNKKILSILWDLEENRVIRKLDVDIPLPSYGTHVAWIDDNRFAHSTSREGIKIFDRQGNVINEWKDPAHFYGRLSISPNKKRMACLVDTFTGQGAMPFVQIRNLSDGEIKSTHCVLPTSSDYELPLSFGPTGHWHGPNQKELEKILCYVAIDQEGQRLMLSPHEFEKRFHWKNDPSKIVAEKMID
ncbi:MAG: hypothetical protein KDA84_02540 [Planctomycetaceae bacterium]|nr:hypothetical protein [Planctomycetaceae bacterium]